jgi:hypothetical protein
MDTGDAPASDRTRAARFEVVFTLVRLYYVRRNEDPDKLLEIDRILHALTGRRARDAGAYRKRFDDVELAGDLIQLAESFFNAVPEAVA